MKNNEEGIKEGFLKKGSKQNRLVSAIKAFFKKISFNLFVISSPTTHTIKLSEEQANGSIDFFGNSSCRNGMKIHSFKLDYFDFQLKSRN